MLWQGAKWRMSSLGGKERGARLVVGSKRKKKPHKWIGISLKGLIV